jgi:2-polyprenyl-3-methyl-5-hydroxy-6-metoxy-1,4-benzoquinol methylase
MPKCRVCNNQDLVKFFDSPNTHGRHPINHQTFPLYHCPACQAYSLDSVEKDPQYYQHSYSPGYYSSNLFKNIFSHLNFIRQQTITRHFPHNKTISLLDVGCGQGEFLEYLSPNKFMRTGLELNQQAVKIAKSKGLNVISGDVNKDLVINQKFDCITLWHVIEHLPNPTSTIILLHKFLNPGGTIIIATPNSNSLGFKYGLKNYFHLDSPRHLTILNKNSLKYILEQAKFTNISFINPFFDFPLDLFWSLRKSKLKYFVYPFYPIFKLLSLETIYATACRR